MSMAVQGLLLSDNSQDAGVICQVMDSLSATSTVVSSIRELGMAMAERTFDMILLDEKSAWHTAEVATAISKSKRNHQTTVVKLTNDVVEASAVRCHRIRLSIPRFTTLDEGRRHLRPIYLQARRRKQASLRTELSVPIRVIRGNGFRVRGKTLNLSETGLALLVSCVLRKDELVSIRLRLPDAKALVHAVGRVIWSSESRAGLKFCLIPNPEQIALQSWVQDQLKVDGVGAPVFPERLPVSA